MDQVVHISIEDDNGKLVFSDFVANVVRQELNRRLDAILLEAAEYRTVSAVINEHIIEYGGYWIMKSLYGFGWVVHQVDDPNEDLKKLKVFATYSDAVKFALELIRSKNEPGDDADALIDLVGKHGKLEQAP